MYEILKKLMKNAYAPYSKFRVAAIVETKDGKFFGGVNVENANYTSICAERNAIATAIARKGDELSSEEKNKLIALLLGGGKNV